MENVLVVKMVNAGKKPINIENIGGKTTKSEIFICPVDLPVMLDESKTHREIYKTTIAEMAKCNELLLEIYVVDSLGKHWNVSDDDIVKINFHVDKLRRVDPIHYC